MTLSSILCVVGLILLLAISKTALTNDGIQIEDGSQGNHVATDHLNKELYKDAWKAQPVIPPGCPDRCSCKNDTNHNIINVDCSSRELTTVPIIPQTTVVLTLENNSISKITCDSFKRLRSLQDLNLASNNISHLLPCVFQSQSDSLVNLNISENNTDYLDTKLFRDLSQLKNLDLSVNIITHLANRTFSDLAQLTHLNLSFNFIKSIAPSALKGLHSSKSLFLQNNHLDDYYLSSYNNVFQDLVALETLDVKANDGVLDNVIATLRNLSYLYMDLTLTTMPALGAGYRQLTNLQVLDVSGVRFMSRRRYKQFSFCGMSIATSTVPSNFFDNILTEKSFELYMSNCLIKDIANDTFNALPTLITLDLNNNPFISFGHKSQGWMASLINTTITFLDLSGTWDLVRHQFLNDSCFQDLSKTNLKILSLKENRIYDIRAYSHFPTTIEKLDVSENSIPLTWLYHSFLASDIPDFKLRELHANDQRYEMVPKQTLQETSDANVGHFSSGYGDFNRAVRAGGISLHSEVSVHDWMSRSLFPHISFNKSVNSLHVGKDETGSGNVWNARRCPLTEPDSNFIYICLPANLDAIYARSAFIPVRKSVPHIRVLNNTVLSHVELTDNLLTNWLGPVENVPSLTFLDLSRNFCENVDVNFFKYMVALETLILRENYIGSSLAIDVDGLTFSTLANLKILDLSQNVIQDLSKQAFVYNTNLETLDLSYNRLTEFQPALSTIRNMSFLKLSRNLLPGLSEETCQELKLLKSRNNFFTVNLLDNRLLFTCDYLPFLDLLISNPHIFSSFEHLEFRYINGTKFCYKDLNHLLPSLARECMIERYFIVILIIFFITVGTVSICAVIYHKRWKLLYLYHTSRRRMHIGERVVDYVPVADVYITYDQDDLRWRRFMQRTFLPGLNQRNITYILGETDFPGGDIMAHVAGAVVGTRKTVVLLSSEIFDDHHREYEINLAIMREMDTRSLKIVPVFVEEFNLALYPAEIELFLRNQWERWLYYSDSDEFWDGFVDAVREDN